MAEKPNGGPVFPRITEIESPNTIGHMNPKYSRVRSEDGMSLRDWFAGQALSAIADNTIDDLYTARIARAAYAIADAMLEARDK